MKILTVSTVFPYPPHDGTRIQIYQRVKHLSEGNEVTLLCVVDREPEPSLVKEMERYCNFHLIRRPTIQFSEGLLARAFNFLRSFAAGVPYYELAHFREEASEWIRSEVRSGKFDVVEADGSASIYLRTPLDALKVWTMHSVSAANEGRTIRFVHGWMRRLTILSYRPITRRYERGVARMVDLVAVLTPENEVELKRIDEKIPASHCLTNGVDLDYFRFEPLSAEPEGVCFVGKMDHYPNHDAALHFYQDIWPAVRMEIPSARLFIVGSKPMTGVVELSGDPSVEVTGFVEDVRPFMRKAGIAVVPLRMGGGILNKVLEAMAIGMPVVASRIAIHGLSVESGRHLLVCDDDAEFAAAVKRLLLDPELRSRMALAGRQYVETYHQWQPIVNGYQAKLEGLLARRRLRG